jgi:predicted MFS family arabinose efflux permease
MLPDTKDESKTNSVSTSFRKVLSNKHILTAVFFSLILNLGLGSIFNFLAMFLSIPKSQGGPGLTFSAIGIVFSVPFILSAIVQRESGKLADRMNKTRLIIISGVLGSFSIMLFPNMTDLIGFISVLGFFWGGISLGMPAIRAIAVLEGRKSGQGTVMSVLQTSENIGNVLGPLLAGIVAELLGLKYVFYMCALIMSIATIGYYLLTRAH